MFERVTADRLRTAIARANASSFRVDRGVVVRSSDHVLVRIETIGPDNRRLGTGLLPPEIIVSILKVLPPNSLKPGNAWIRGVVSACLNP